MSQLGAFKALSGLAGWASSMPYENAPAGILDIDFGETSVLQITFPPGFL